MCCCVVYPPSIQEISFFFSLLVFRRDTFSLLSSSVFPSLVFPSLFPFIPLLVVCSLPLLSMFLLSCLVLDIAVVDHVNIFVPNSVHFGVGPFPQLSHSGLFICNMHFGITHPVPHHCSPALIAFIGISHHNSRGESAFSLVWLSLWTLSLLKTDFVHDRHVSVMAEKRCYVASGQSRRTC